DTDSAFRTQSVRPRTRKTEEWQEPNEFYLHHLPLLQEAVEHVSTKVTALKAKVEMAAEKHKKTASHNKIQQRRQAKRAKLHAIINVTEGPGDDCQGRTIVLMVRP
ncbi:Hypothetical predicted protein, partial [Paramuricea clavata]